MKLHLPKLLRNSVLACITAVAGIATTTVGTATFTGGVVAFALSQQQVQAATLTQIADMATLVEGATIHESVVDTSGEGYTSYRFNGQGAITNISNAAVLEAITSTSTTNYLTVAAWIKVDATSGVQSIFSYGAQNTGVKFATNGSNLGFTTKGVSDVQTAPAGLVAGEWKLVAITFCLDNADNDRYLVGPTDGSYYTKNFSQMNAPAEADQIFAIGAGNAMVNDNGGVREGFTGEIQNLTIFTSDGLVNNSAIAQIMGTTAPSLLSVPTLTWDTAADDNTWSGNAWKTNDNASASWASENQAVFAGAGEEVTLSGEISALGVRVTGEGWRWVGDGTLDVTEKIAIGDGSTATSLDISGLTNTPADGMTVNAGATLLIGGKTMTFDEAHRMDGKVVIGNGGIVIVSTNSGSTSYIGGEVEIQQGGTLQLLGGNDITGWGESGTDKISILGGTLEMKGRQTWGSILEMKGGATVRASAEPGTDNANAPAFETYGGSFVAEGTGNKIEDSVKIWTNRAMTIEVKDGGDLEIAGRVAVRTGGGASITKSGAGTLKFTNAGESGNTFAQVYNQTAGTTIISGTAATFSKGINITGGTFQADTDITLGGTITNAGTLVLNGNVTVDENSLGNFAYTEGELTGTTNGLTDYDVHYTIIDGAANTGSTTTLTCGGQTYNLTEGIAGTKQGYVIAEGTVNVGGSSPAADTTGITRFYIAEGGTMNLSTREEGAALTAEQILLQATGTGTIAVQSDMVLDGFNNGLISDSSGSKEITGWNTPKFTGTIAVQAGTLKLGNGGSQNNGYALDLSGIKSLDLDGGNVRAFVADTTINTVNVKKAGTFNVFQASLTGVTEENPDGNPGLVINNLVLEDDLNFNFEWTSQVAIKSLSGNGAFSVNSAREAQLTIESVDGAGPISLGGGTLTTTLGVDETSQLTLGGTITTSKALVVNGKITIAGDMDGYTLVEAGSLSDELSGGTDGYKAMKGGTYLLLDNNCVSDGQPHLTAITWNAGMTATMGTETVTLTKDEVTGDISFSGGDSFDTIYHVNTADIVYGGENATEDTARATGFAVAEDRTVTIAGAENTTAAGNLLYASTGTGTIELQTSAKLEGTNLRADANAAPRTTAFAGTISVKNGTLNIGDEGNAGNFRSSDLTSLKAIELDGGSLRYFGASTSLSRIDVKQASTFSIHESVAKNDKALEIQEIALNKDLTIQGTWAADFSVAKLTGTGDIAINKGSNGGMTASIGAIEGCGALTNNGAVLTIGTDASTVLNLGGTITNVNHANGSLTVNGKVVISGDLGNYTIAAEGQQVGDTLSKNNGQDGYKTITGATYYLLDNQATRTEGEGDAAQTVDKPEAITWNAGDTASYNGSDVTLTKDAATGDITFVGGTTLDSVYYVNTQDITIGGDNATEDTERATAFELASGRTMTIAGTADAARLLKMVNSGADSTVVVDSELTTPIYLNADMSNLAGTLDIQGGRVIVGGANTNSSGANVAFAPAKLIVGDGGEFTSNFGQGANTPKEIATAIDLQSGAKLSNVDGHMKYTGNIRFNVDGAGYNADGVVTLDSHWGKNLELAGQLEGAGTVQLLNTRATAGGNDQHVNFRISGAANTFSGTYKLADGTEGTSENDTINLYVLHENALKGTSVDMASTTCKSNLYLGANAELVSLNGADADNAVKANAADVTLTVSKGSFGGSLMNTTSGSGESATTNVLSLTKKGTETLSLGGTIGYTGATTVQGGTLAFTGTGALTLGSISTVGSAQITTASALTLAAGSALTMDLTGATTANALIGVGAGTFSITDATCAITLSNADSLEDGDYKLISWAEANNAITLEKFDITGVELGAEYALKVENNALILSKVGSDTLNWDTANDTWAVGSAFAPAGSDKVNFEDKDVAVFSGVASGTTSEAVAIKGTVNSKSVTITPGEGNTYTFTSHADGGQLSTAKLAIGAGTVSFGTGSLNLDTAFTEVSVADKGVLDLSALSTKKVFTKFAGVAAGDGTVKLGGADLAGDNARINMRDLGTGGETTTAVKYEVASDMAINAWVAAGSAAANTLNIAKDFTVGGELRLESNAVVNVTGGTLAAGTIGLGHSTGNDTVELKVSAGGTVKAGSIANTAAGTHKVTMTGGTLELTGEGGIAAGITTDIQAGKLVANTADWGITGATISGGVEIAGANTITLTDTQLKGTLTNNGKLALAGTINIAPTTDFQTQEASEQFSGADGNGFKFADVTYTIASGSGSISVAEGTAWQLDGTAATNATYAGGQLNVKGAQQGTLYWANTGTVTYGAEGIAGATGIALNGGSVALNASLADSMTAGLDVKAAGTVTLGEGAELAASQVNGATATNKVTLDGSGTYDLGSDISLGAGVGLAESWQGTVETSVTSITTDTTLALGDKVDFTAEKVTLSADLTTGGALTMNALQFGSLDVLLTVGGALSIDSIMVDTDLLSSTTVGEWELAKVGSLVGESSSLSKHFSGLGEDGLYDYELSWDGTTLKLTGSMNADYVWGGEDDNFGGSSEQEWVSTPGMEDANVAFTGGCSSDGESGTTAGKVNVDDSGVKVNNVTITTSDQFENPQTEYTFVGGSLESTGDLNVLNGTSLTVSNESSFEGAATVKADSALTVAGDKDVAGSSASLTVGSLTSEGSVVVSDSSSLTVTGDLENKGGSITVAGTSTISAGGALTTDKLTITGELQSGADYLVSVGSLANDVVIDLDDDSTVNNIKAGIYNLMSILGEAATVTLDAADIQAILEKGFGCSGLTTAAPFSLRAVADTATPTTITMEVRQLKDSELIWNTNDDVSTGGLQLGTLTDGTMVLSKNSILDSIKTVDVKADTTLDLSGSNDTAAVNLKGLKGTKDLSIVGNGDTVNVVSSGYEGNLILNNVAANLNMADSTVVAANNTVSLSGQLTDGTLMVSKDSAAKGDLVLRGDSTLAITIAQDSAVIDHDTLDKIADNGIVDMDSISGNAEVKIGTYDKATGAFTESFGYNKYFSSIYLDDGKVIADRNTSYYSDAVGYSASANGAAGLAMADEALLYENPQATKDSALGAVLNQLDRIVASGDSAAADKLGASLAGASTAVLGMATLGDVDRQLQAIRNRTTTMGVDQAVANEDMPYFNAWINAEGDMTELSESGTESGYDLTSWGGTVGFDVDFCPTFTAGMALTAMYGDLDTTGADQATGNLDTYYVSAFARYAPSAWTHTFVATVGMADISLDRTVAGVQTSGETDGMSFGLMYEVGRVYALDEDGTACLQPIFNVAWKHTAVDSYTEKGGDIALNVDEQTLDTVTFGLGARLQAVVGESMYNRTSILEARVLAKADAGDTQGDSGVALGALGGKSYSMKSAEMGAFGLEAGAGLTIPLGQDSGSVFMDASIELRSDYTNVNGTVGYRLNF